MGTNHNARGNDSAARALSRCPIPWAKHEAANAANPCVNQLIDVAGFEGYGRYWRLFELLLADASHSVPHRDEQGYKRYMFGLGFADAESFETFLGLLLDLDLIAADESGRRYIAVIEDAALAYGQRRYNGGKGGTQAAQNRRANKF